MEQRKNSLVVHGVEELNFKVIIFLLILNCAKETKEIEIVCKQRSSIECAKLKEYEKIKTDLLLKRNSGVYFF